MSIEVTDDLVKHVALLCRLATTEENVTELKEHFRKVLAYVEELQGLPVDDVDPAYVAAGAGDVYREDASRPSLPRGEALRNAPGRPAAEPGKEDVPFFIVPRIVEKGRHLPPTGPGGAS